MSTDSISPEQREALLAFYRQEIAPLAEPLTVTPELMVTVTATASVGYPACVKMSYAEVFAAIVSDTDRAFGVTLLEALEALLEPLALRAVTVKV